MQTKSKEKNIYENLLAAGFTKSEIDSTLYKFLQAEIEQRKIYRKLSAAGKVLWHVKNLPLWIRHFHQRLKQILLKH